MNANLEKVRDWRKSIRAKLRAKGVTAGKSSLALLTAAVDNGVVIPAAYKRFIITQAETQPKYVAQAAVVSGGSYERPIKPATKQTKVKKTTGRGKNKKTTTTTTTTTGGLYSNASHIMRGYNGKQGNLFGAR